jgi:hypothetical protein
MVYHSHSNSLFLCVHRLVFKIKIQTRHFGDRNGLCHQGKEWGKYLLSALDQLGYRARKCCQWRGAILSLKSWLLIFIVNKGKSTKAKYEMIFKTISTSKDVSVAWLEHSLANTNKTPQNRPPYSSQFIRRVDFGNWYVGIRVNTSQTAVPVHTCYWPDWSYFSFANTSKTPQKTTTASICYMYVFLISITDTMSFVLFF